MNSHLRKYIIAAAAIIVIIAAAVVVLPRSGYYLTLRNRDTGEVYARYKMGEGDRFSVTFIHSVNKYPLTDTYEIENKTIYVEETTYCSFGAGVQTELNPGETLDKVYAQAFGTEDALVRHNFVSGTHALSTALWGVLRSGDTMVSVTGAPYDTLEEVIGIAGTKGSGSLIDYGVKYKQIDLMSDGKPDLDKIALEISDAKVAYIQRSRGYSLRPALSIDDIKDICRMVKNVNPNAVIMVDNCYGEFLSLIHI